MHKHHQFTMSTTRLPTVLACCRSLAPLRPFPSHSHHQTIRAASTSSLCTNHASSLRWRPYPLPIAMAPRHYLHRNLNTTTQSSPQPLPSRPAPHRNPNEPIYELTFTCKACQHRSAHTVSKQGYHKGTVLITCPGCKARHLISDHLHIFSDTKVTLEDIMKEKGEVLRKGNINAEGDVEFWPERGEGEGAKGKI